jgi:hypothetical protein
MSHDFTSTHLAHLVNSSRSFKALLIMPSNSIAVLTPLGEIFEEQETSLVYSAAWSKLPLI